ncbi:MAG TPA: DNA ligase D [Candidatus Saccharimonadales bacterium]|nr:DNA ligase D [Candidatus Saccharimonadales bacterium]
MGLGKYFKKRRFSQTPEPANKDATEVHKDRLATHRKLRFVVQEHHASTLHYDFRLEMNGVLKSWAVPKGPSLDPRQHHLAIQTEDHPFDYRSFEGVIPEGNYGAGNVIIWDEGWYEARKGDPAKSEATLAKELEKGHLTFILHGKKLQGEFALINMPRAREENAWLLVKKGDKYAATVDITKADTSVKSGKHVDDLGARGKLPDLSACPKRAKPWAVKPMLTTLMNAPFSREGWLFEIKWDGYRAVGSKHGDGTELYSRNGIDFAEKYPPVVEALRAFKHDVIVDGEIVTVDAHGASHFEWLQNWHQEPRGILRYYLFDILWCDGHDVRGMPLAQRKVLLGSVMPKHPVLAYSDDVEAAGEKLFAEMRRRGLEGMVAKRADSTYHEADRSTDWLKVKTSERQEVVIGGYTEPRGSRTYLGSLLVGVYQNGQLHYVGHSGGGIADDQRKQLHRQLSRLERRTPPFATEPKPNAPVHWVRPELVCEMSFSEWTGDGYMRQPRFEGLRPDKKPEDVHRERPSSGLDERVAPPLVEPDRDGRDPRLGQSDYAREQSLGLLGAGRNQKTTLPFEPTHLDKVFFPKHRYTKGDLFTYYKSVAEYILPYLQDRPCSLNRMPSGINGESFFQKNNERLPAWVPHADIFSESNNADLRWIVGGEVDVLLYMVQLGCIEINPWNSRVGHLNKPDWIVIDLDPEGVGFADVISVARTVKEVCDEWHIPSCPKTSGKTGLHLFIPMQAKYTYEQGKNLAHLIALEVHQRQPKLTSVERLPEKRKHKIYLDFLQNREGQTLAAPYSVRPTPDATVSMPLHWDEVRPGLKPTTFTIKNAHARLARTGDLWKPALAKGVDLPAIIKTIEQRN